MIAKTVTVKNLEITNSFLLKPSIRFCLMVLLLYSFPIILTTTIAKKNLNCDAKNVVKCQIMGKLKIPNSPNSKVKNPKTFIFNDESRITKKGKMKDMKIRILLVLFSNNFCNSKFKSRNIWLKLKVLV